MLDPDPFSPAIEQADLIRCGCTEDEKVTKLLPPKVREKKTAEQIAAEVELFVLMGGVIQEVKQGDTGQPRWAPPWRSMVARQVF